MTTKLQLAVAQMGPVARSDPRERPVERMIVLLRQAAARGAGFVVFPELALTTFFPRWFMTDDAEIDAFYEEQMPGPATAPLFAEARRLKLGFMLGYGELVRGAGGTTRFNTTIMVGADGGIIGKYRKIHVPGHREHEPKRAFQHLEKRYFATGNLGFPVYPLGGTPTGMLICNDRRWPEAWRMLALGGAQLVCVGYNTTLHNPEIPQHDHLVSFHHLLSMQAGAYQSGVWAAAAAKAGHEEGSHLLGHSCIVAPTGEIVALASTLGDEVITTECDFGRCREIRDNIFNFERHRQPEHYQLVTRLSA
ncbi:N-carbamoyl-D-amino-acid hydrolase [Bosea sp. NPDC003192]|uniref:N-carbamoyl-D-amino-acid hydrolase n=1 Tax=Bosea sp. NPDC003192 TaxID=3390551 RepID=UPI003CFFCFE0